MMHAPDNHPLLRMAVTTASMAALGQTIALRAYGAMWRGAGPGPHDVGAACARPACPHEARRRDEVRVEEGFDNLPI